jgi:adenosylcobinamide-GDP ribazoletransferase
MQQPTGSFDWQGWIDDLRVAVILFTRLPLRRGGDVEAADLARALRVAPVVGIGVGIAGAVAFAVASRVGLPPLAAGLLAVLATVGLTGAYHEDGLADSTDGLAGKSADDSLAIMRDSRSGTYGVLALVFSVGLRAAAVAALAEPAAAAAGLIAAGAASRAAPAALLAWLPAARGDGLAAQAGAAGTPDATRGRAVIAAIIGAVVAILALGLDGAIPALILAVAGITGVGWLARRRLGGYTGDVMGAAQQVAEVAVLLAAAALA